MKREIKNNGGAECMTMCYGLSEGEQGEELIDLPKGATISNYTLKGYEDLKETLNDIESQLDRIIAKKKLIKS